MSDATDLWIEASRETVASYRRLIDAAVGQLSDEEFFHRPAPGFNSVAVILRHLGGNLQSRWTDFLTTDGEKPDRNRDTEFEDWPGDRASLMAYFDEGWSRLVAAVDEINDDAMTESIFIRGEAHTLPMALARSITHVASHAGQIVLIARLVHRGEWRWLSIAPGESRQHNAENWGTPASRCVLGEPTEERGGA